MIRTKRWSAIAATVASLASIVVLGMDQAHQAPRVRLHGGAAWLVSSQVGQLTLVDGASAEVAARVPVAPPGSPLRSAQLGSTGYVLNQRDGSVVRVDGATLEPSTPSSSSADRLFPTVHAVYTVDSSRGLLTPTDPATLATLGPPHSLAGTVEDAIVDSDGRLWVLNRQTGDLAWFLSDARHSRANAGTASKTHLAVSDGRPTLLDLARGTAELLDPQTGSVVESIRVDVRTDDRVAVSGSARGTLISIASRGLLMVCEFGASCKNPVPLGSGAADLGAAVEVGDHVVVPDYSTGRVWIVNLHTMRVVVERKLFDRPVRFELLTRDGLVFYNDPDSDQAGVLDLDGHVRAVSKHVPTKPDNNRAAPVVDSHEVSRQPLPPKPDQGSKPDNTPPVHGPGPRIKTDPFAPPATPTVAITITPRDRGLVGDEFDLTASTPAVGIATARWTFGDGSEATGTTVRHRWDRPGNFSVSVATTLITGQTVPVATRTVAIEPRDAPPRILRLTISPTSPRVGQQVKFSAELAGGLPDHLEWTVPGAVTSNQREFEHTFTAPGTYTATFTVTAGPLRVRQSQPIIVTPELPAAACGDILTASAVLKSDLTCPGNVGLTIAANDVVLDLGGHELTTATPTDHSTGIRVDGPVSGVTIENGDVTQFKTGIAMADVTGVKVSKVNLASSSEAGSEWSPIKGADIAGDNAKGVNLDAVTLNGRAPFLFDRDSQVGMTGSTVGNPALRSESHARCRGGSSCSAVKTAFHLKNLDCELRAPSVQSVIAIDNSDIDADDIGRSCGTVAIINSRARAITAWGIKSLLFSGNTVSTAGARRGAAMSGDEPSTRIRVSGNSFSSMDVGMEVISGTGEIVGNTFVNNAHVGLLLGRGRQSLQISENLFEGNGDGEARMEIKPGPRGGLSLSYNQGHPAHPGEFAERVAVVSKNQSKNNLGYGFFLLSPVSDGGGNTSSGNLLGCFGPVTC
ncbi:PKD repeat-containing protein [Kibdelosporangium aridum]|uniref:PKD repeat-containing protein n=1 Tax=Kibdelosporangium aridum TaxID=2030 RepID=A0A1W2FZY2_KIBAR|nr:PKD repeat-containing protein [Kibdelosporangium aridum]